MIGKEGTQSAPPLCVPYSPTTLFALASQPHSPKRSRKTEFARRIRLPKTNSSQSPLNANRSTSTGKTGHPDCSIQTVPKRLTESHTAFPEQRPCSPRSPTRSRERQKGTKAKSLRSSFREMSSITTSVFPFPVGQKLGHESFGGGARDAELALGRREGSLVCSLHGRL